MITEAQATGDQRSDLYLDITVTRGDRFVLDVEFDIPAGSTTAVLGPNGAGKSTIVDAVAGLLTPDRGVIRLGDRTLTDVTSGVAVPVDRRNVGVVFQNYLLFDHLDVVDNVAFGPRSRGVGRRASRTRAHRWLDRLDLADIATRRPPELSGGQAQRVALARALAAEPEVLLLDEPLAAVDVATRARLRRILLGHLEQFAGPRLLITHDPTDATLLADRVVVIEDGSVAQRGEPDDIRRRPATPYVAALAGTNLLAGTVRDGSIRLRDHPHSLTVADSETSGEVLVTIHPRAIALHASAPAGSPRNVWPTTVDIVEPLGDTTRVVLGSPVPLAVDITPASAAELGLRSGTAVWVSVKATEIQLTTV